MAFRLERKKTTSTPYILVDEANNYMKMEGRCFHENAGVLFKEINNWLDGYLLTDFETFTFDSNISYFNSSTTKLMFDILKKLDLSASAQKKVTVNWITHEANEVMAECGTDFKADMQNLRFNLITVKEPI